MPRVIAVIALCCLCGCQYDPYTSVYTTKEPKSQDVVGRYLPNRETCDYVLTKGRYAQCDASITLSADGSFSITNMPDWWNSSGEPRGGFDSGTGKWKVGKHQEWWSVVLEFP